MKLREIRALRGPNYWSGSRHNLIVMKLDLEELEYKPTDKIEGFYERLKLLIPSLHTHTCSEGVPGGFFQRVEDGTWMGHVIEHIAIEIQILAGMYCPFGKTRGSGEVGVYNVVFEYQDEEAGFYAAKAAINIATSLINGFNYDIRNDIDYLSRLRITNMLGPSTQALVNEAVGRGIPCRRLDKDSLVLMGYGKQQKLLSSSIVNSTSCIGVDIACNKVLTRKVLENARIPIPKGVVVHDEETLLAAASKFACPLVIKPVNGNHGRCVSINLHTQEELLNAFFKAKKCSDKILIEELICGFDYRILVVDYKFIAATKRTPASVTGDGKSTIQQLIDRANGDSRRGCGHEKELTKIEVDDSTHFILKRKGYSLASVIAENETVYLKSTANLSTGGTGIDVTDTVHPYNMTLAERVAKIIGLNICGIDVMAPCLSIPINNNGGVILEVNAEPGLRMHLLPTEGVARNVAKPVIDMLFPDQHNGRIPITAITGTNGKTTTSRLIAHFAATAGFHTGLTTSDGIYINGKTIDQGDCTGPDSSEIVLREPDVDFAVLECARGGILRSGLGFQHCDVGIVTNVTEDHLGLGDIHTLEHMANLKSVVPKSITPAGYAVLNADDVHVYAMSEDLVCNIALFSLDRDNPKIRQHCKNGGAAAYLDNGNIIIEDGGYSEIILPVSEIPLTFEGKAVFNIQNTLAAVLAGYIHKLGMQNIKNGLKTFLPTSTAIPGRMNLFQFPEFEMLIDYAHNPSAINALGVYVKSVPATYKVGIITAVGDRRDSDIINLGKSAAHIFDEIIIKHDNDLRGRSRNEITSLLIQGKNLVTPEKPVKVISSETEAIRYAIQNARPGSFITALSAEVPQVISLIQELIEKEEVKEKLLE